MYRDKIQMVTGLSLKDLSRGQAEQEDPGYENIDRLLFVGRKYGLRRK